MLAAELWHRADRVVSSPLVYPEARAAAAAARRGRRITSATMRSAVDRIDELCTELDVIGLDAGLAHTAGELAEAHGDLATTALAAGCSVSPPPAHR